VEKIYIRGGSALRGSIRISGSKNSSLAIMAACLLVDGKTTLRNVPEIHDIYTMAEMLQEVGAEVRFRGSGVCEIDASGFCRTSAPEELVRKMRASFYVLGPMLARLGSARVPQPGGCEIGARPIDFHVKGMQALGAYVRTEGGIVEAYSEGLRAAKIYLDFPSAGATTHLMTAACLAAGVTTIENAATEPEVADLGGFLRALGARVEGAGTSTVFVEGMDKLRTGCEYTIIPDRMEAGTFACASAITRGNVVLENVIPSQMQPVLVKLQAMGVSITALSSNPDRPGLLRISARERCRAEDILAMPHPGFPTDMQQPMAALLCVSRGAALVTDRVFENRFRYVGELERMGADIRVEGRTAFIHGVERLKGAPVMATDLRAGAALIVAALAAEGESVISGVEHLDRGYSGLVEKLQGAGADIVRADVEQMSRVLSVV
jgi:UDP-N-acetylglucosamine 1-carboxyvinyltransferase